MGTRLRQVSILMGLLIVGLTSPAAVMAAGAVTVSAATNGTHSAIQEETLASLAVLVPPEPGNRELADKLRPMVEMEVQRQWGGSVVERRELDRMVAEFETALAGKGAAGDRNAPKTGGVKHANYLLTVKVMPARVTASVARFPEAAVICENDYTERLDPFPLSVRIVTDAVRGIRQSVRDPHRPLVSLGAFSFDDPHRRLFGFSREVDRQLRRELAKENKTELAERLFPSELLKEYELARGGLAARMDRHLVAPTADILMYGEFAPRKGQKLEGTNMLLDVTVHLAAPTGLCPKEDASFVCRTDEPEALVGFIVKRVRGMADRAGDRLRAGAPRGFSEEEFAVFKKQAFGMLPLPPMESGEYFGQGGWQSFNGGERGIYDQYERVLHMLECAAMFKGNDSQVLVCIGVALYGMARPNGNMWPDIAVLDEAAGVMFERAYCLESNFNTRGFYAGLGAGSLRCARQVWNTRDAEPWWPHQVHGSLLPLLGGEKNFPRQRDLFLEALPGYVAGRYGDIGYTLRNLSAIASPFMERAITNDTPEVRKQVDEFAEKLCADPSLFVTELGHLLAFRIRAAAADARSDKKKDPSCAGHLREAIRLLPEIRKTYGEQEFSRWQHGDTFEACLGIYSNLQQAAGIKDEGVDQLRAAYDGLWKPAGDAPPLKPREPAAKREPLDIKAFERIAFDDGKAGWVVKLVSSKHGIWGIRDDPSSHGWGNDRKHAFRLAADAREAGILKQFPADVRDLDFADGLLGVGSQANGFYLMDMRDSKVRQYLPENSTLPGRVVKLVCGRGSSFYVGVEDSNQYYVHVYGVDAREVTISHTPVKLVTHAYWQMKVNAPGTEEWPVIPQTWLQRTTATDGGRWLFTRTDGWGGMENDVAVRKLKDDGARITLADGRGLVMSDEETPDWDKAASATNIVFSYHGNELDSVYDFAQWQGRILFATGNGLYVSTPMSNDLHRVLAEQDCRALCPLEDRIYLGTTSGLYVLPAVTYREKLGALYPGEKTGK